jgi:cyclophilin family peptidyl-prolyl cis-trans isomerase
MTRARIGLLLTLVLVGCDHHKPIAPSTPSAGGAAVAQPESDAAYTGQPPAYPRAKPVTLPPAAATNSVASSVPPPAPLTPPPAPAPEVAATTPSSVPAPTLVSTPPPAAPMDATPAPAPADVTPPTPAAVPPPVMDDDEARKQVVILNTSLGRIVIQLDDIYAPRTCGNFRKLVTDGFYNHTTFHRVIPNFMIQGGDPNSKSDDRSTYGQGDPGYTLPAEIKLKHVAGAVAMARLPDKVNPQRESNGSQFFICVTTCPSLDDQYTVFGHVIQGMDVANKIAAAQRDEHDDPVDRIEMEASLESKKQALEDTAPAQ